MNIPVKAFPGIFEADLNYFIILMVFGNILKPVISGQFVTSTLDTVGHFLNITPVIAKMSFLCHGYKNKNFIPYGILTDKLDQTHGKIK